MTLDDYAVVVEPPKWQRNAIFKAVVAGGLDAAGCRLDAYDGGWRITHVSSQSYFVNEGVVSPFTTSWVVGDNPPWRIESYSWTAVTDRVQRWAEEVRRDVDTPDLWAGLRDGQGMLTGVGHEGVENTPFSPQEQVEIRQGLQEVKGLVESMELLSETQRMSVLAKLDDMATAAGRVGRKDWLLMFGGVVLSVLMEQLLPKDAVWDIISTVGRDLGHLFSRTGLTPLLPTTPPGPFT